LESPAEEIEEVMETKKFYLTSEFWLTVGIIVASFADVIPVPEKYRAAIISVSVAAYAISRGLAKAGVEPFEEDPSG